MEASVACCCSNSITPFKILEAGGVPKLLWRAPFALHLPFARGALSTATYGLAIHNGDGDAHSRNRSNPSTVRSLPPSSVHSSREKYIAPKFEVRILVSKSLKMQ